MNGGVLADPAPRAIELEIPIGPGLPGDLAVPAAAAAVTLFAHGSGSSRLSPRNRFVAGELNRRRIATLLFDLLTPDEEADRANVFDVDLLGERLLETTRWLVEQPPARGLQPCFFGASTGAAAALAAAAELGPAVRAVVSRGGRPDLAERHLGRVRSPTLLIVGGDDRVVLELNRSALTALPCEKRLAIVRRAGHLFQEPGALERVALLAGDWLVEHLGGDHVEGGAAVEVEVVDPLLVR
jgi:putative phosphoribosyl transferase